MRPGANQTKQMDTTTMLPAVQPKSGEMAVSASAALAKATIEAKFAVAIHRPRSIETARLKLLENCKRKGFAETAKYKIPRWNAKEQRYVDTEGFSIRFAEAAVQSWGNVDVTASIAFEDEEKRMVRVAVTDLETNISFTDEVVLSKTVERSKKAEGTIVVAERTNTDGKKVFIVKATEDELLMKVNSAKSKSIRTSGLRLLPQDILDEAWDVCTAAVEKGGTDPALDKKRLCDGFHTIGVSPKDLEDYLGYSISQVSPAVVSELRKLYTSIKDGETTWPEIMKAAKTVDVKAEPVKTAEPTTKKVGDDIPMNFANKAAPSFDVKGQGPVTASAPDQTPDALTPAQLELQDQAAHYGISFEALRGKLIEQKKLSPDAICDGFHMVPNGLCEALLAMPRVLQATFKSITPTK